MGDFLSCGQSFFQAKILQALEKNESFSYLETIDLQLSDALSFAKKSLKLAPLSPFLFKRKKTIKPPPKTRFSRANHQLERPKIGWKVHSATNFNQKNLLRQKTKN